MLAVFQGQGNHGPLVVGAGGHFQRAVLRGRILREQLTILVHPVHEVMAFLHAAVGRNQAQGDDFAGDEIQRRLCRGLGVATAPAGR